MKVFDESVRLMWQQPKSNVLTLKSCCVEGVSGLSEVNRRLWEQHQIFEKNHCEGDEENEEED